MARDLEGKVAIITGGGTGIGRAVALGADAGFAGKAWVTGRSLLVEDILNDERFSLEDDLPLEKKGLVVMTPHARLLRALDDAIEKDALFGELHLHTRLSMDAQGWGLRLGPDDHVALLMGNRVEFVELILGAILAFVLIKVTGVDREVITAKHSTTLALATWRVWAMLRAPRAMPVMAADTIKLGVAGAHSGDLASYGLPSVNAAKLVVADINAKGGIDGKMVELMVEDDVCKPEVATNTATKLVSEGVDLVLGHICSGATKAALPIYNSGKVVVMSPSATNPGLTQSGDYPNFFRTIASDDAQARMPDGITRGSERLAKKSQVTFAELER